MKRLLMALTSAAVLSVGYVGYATLPSDGYPEKLASLLAERLSEHSLDGVPMTRDSDRDEYRVQVSALVDYPVDVSVERVEEAGDSATATLSWEWRLPGGPWRYSTSANLVDDGARWEVDWDPTTLEPSLDDGHDLGISVLAAPRGRILGNGGVPVVRPRPVVRYGLDKTQVKPRVARRSARKIAAALDINASDFVERVRGAGPEAFVEALTLRVEDARERVDVSFGEIPGAAYLEAEIPLAPTREFAAEILGRVGPATAEIIEKSEGRVQAGDVVGLSGLQARYENRLAGTSGIEVYAVAPGGERRTLFRKAPRPGRDLRTTLHPELQMKAEEVLASLGEEGPRSALVAIRPSDGAILAAANGPGNGGLNVATAGRYAPGSTFKVVTALALLRAGVDPQDILPCPATTTVDGRRFKNYDDYPADGIGDITFTTAIAQSCNTALIDARDRLHRGQLTAAAEALGLGRDRSLGFPAYFGQVPPPEGETATAAQLIGQGTVLASPMTMAAVAASVTAGHAVVPTLLPDHTSAPRRPDRPLSTQETRALRAMMRAVVADGSGRFLADLPGELGAKTGTAEYGQPDDNGELRTHAWMIANRADLAVAVFVEDGRSGSSTAGPLLEQFLR